MTDTTRAARAEQRDRLLGGVVQATAEHGYRRLSVLTITRHAGMARASFYSHFANVDEAFDATYELVTGQLLEAIESASADADPPERLRAGLQQLLTMVTEYPDVAQLCFVEAPGAGHATRQHRDNILRRTAAWIADETPPPLPTQIAAAGLHEIVAQRLRVGDIIHTPELLRDLTDALERASVR
jgi:AcrR family transcriptional regulator